MSLYTLALFVHILGVLGWFLATALEVLILWSMRRARTIAQVREWVSLDAPMGGVFTVITLLILAAGIFMMVTGHWNWTSPWIDVSFIALVLMSAGGPVVNAPRFKAIHSAMQGLAEGPLPASLSDSISHPVLWTSILTNATMSVGIIYLMTNKPDWLGALLTALIALVLGLVLGQWQSRRSRTSIITKQQAQHI